MDQLASWTARLPVSCEAALSPVEAKEGSNTLKFSMHGPTCVVANANAIFSSHLLLFVRFSCPLRIKFGLCRRAKLQRWSGLLGLL